MLVPILMLLLQAAAPAKAGAAPSAEARRPAGIAPAGRGGEAVLADARGRTLYVMNSRVARSRSGVGDAYCVAVCAERWVPLAATAELRPSADWTVVQGAAGPQWAYRANPVFTFRGDAARGDRKGAGWEDLFSVIAYVPPAPPVLAPAGVGLAFKDGRWRFVDAQARALYATTRAKSCGAACANWKPLHAGQAALAVGAWTVQRDLEGGRWAYRGQPVWIADDVNGPLPQGGVALEP